MFELFAVLWPFGVVPELFAVLPEPVLILRQSCRECEMAENCRMKTECQKQAMATTLAAAWLVVLLAELMLNGLLLLFDLEL